MLDVWFYSAHSLSVNRGIKYYDPEDTADPNTQYLLQSVFNLWKLIILDVKCIGNIFKLRSQEAGRAVAPSLKSSS